jgi:hypothetical protein
MKVRNVFAAAMLSGALFAVPAFAQGPQGGFSALEGVDAQALSVEEMEAISGQLNAYDIAAALFAQAATLNGDLAAQVTALANSFLANAVQINALFAQFQVLTPCTAGSLCR